MTASLMGIHRDPKGPQGTCADHKAGVPEKSADAIIIFSRTAVERRVHVIAPVQ